MDVVSQPCKLHGLSYRQLVSIDTVDDKLREQSLLGIVVLDFVASWRPCSLSQDCRSVEVLNNTRGNCLSTPTTRERSPLERDRIQTA
jgi:hypothetical protein